MAWTNITDALSWQDLAVAQEIATQYNKRAYVAGASTLEARLGVSAITSAVTVYAFVRAAQEGIEALYGSFADSGATLAGQSAQLSTFATLQAFFNAAGLTGSGGWRRIANDGSNPVPWTNYGAAGWAYGKITDKDLAGPWLYKDLQVALTGLRRYVHTGMYPYSSTTYSKYDSASKSATDATGWNSACDTLAGNAAWTSTGLFGDGMTLVRGTKTLAAHYTPPNPPDYWTSSVTAFSESTAFVAALPFSVSVAGSATRSFIALHVVDSTTDPFSAITGLTAGQLGKTVNLGDNGGGSVIVGGVIQPAIPYPVYYGSANPSWQSIVDRVATPTTASYLEVKNARLVLASMHLIMDFNWL